MNDQSAATESETANFAADRLTLADAAPKGRGRNRTSTKPRSGRAVAALGRAFAV